ncbi:MAG: cell division protein FtsA [Alphaproteobacteria bacterium]|jgi:cell division protein FtsA|nr:cell division protein FtsA [Alphaproteobacteria bacterium]
MAVGRNRIVAALDVGSNKVCCFIARPDGAGGARVVGIGHQVSRGVRSGLVTDMEAVETSIRAAVDAAERMAGDTVQRVYTNLSAGRLNSRTVSGAVAIQGHQIGDGDIRRVLAQARAQIGKADGDVLHALPIGHVVDGSRGIQDPRGMHGERLGIDLHVLSAAPGPLRNLKTAIQHGHLEVEDFAFSAYASGLSALVSDEMDLGVTLVEMGAGTTGIAVFYEGALVFADSIGVGGGHVTNDIARGLSTPANHAERMKTLYGSAIPGPADEREMVTVPQVGETGGDAIQQVPKSILIGIIQPRIEETLELVRDRLAASSYARMAGRRLVLTGGASQLTGVRELAARILDKQVRIGRPLRLQGLAEATEGPAFATCAGLLSYAIRRPDEARGAGDGIGGAEGGRLSRVGRWLKENF